LELQGFPARELYSKVHSSLEIFEEKSVALDGAGVLA